MPIFGTYKPANDTLPEVKKLAAEKVEIEKVQTLTFTFETYVKDALALMPGACHPPFPTYCSLAVRHHEDSPYGPFTIAELRIHVRATALFMGYCLGAWTDNAAAAKWLTESYGAPVQVAKAVKLYKRHYGFDALVETDQGVILDATQQLPGPINGSDVLYVPNLNLAKLDGEVRLVAEEFEYQIKEAKRGTAKFRTLDLGGFGGTGLKPSNHLPSTFTTGSWSYTNVRYTLDADKPALGGARKVA